MQPQLPLLQAPGLLPGEDLFLPEQVSNDIINQGDGRVQHSLLCAVDE